jgi:hypothetical protein
MEILNTYRLVDFESGVINATGKLKLIAEKTNTSNFIPITGTEEGNPISGNLEFDYDTSIKAPKGDVIFGIEFDMQGDGDQKGFLGTEGSSQPMFKHSIDGLLFEYATFNAGEGLIGSKDFSETDPENKLIYAQRKYVDNQIQTPITIIDDGTVALSTTTQRKYYGITASGALCSLPPIEDYEGKTIIVANKSAGTQSVFSNDSVSNDIWNNGTTTNEIEFTGTIELFNDGINWVLVAKS